MYEADVSRKETIEADAASRKEVFDYDGVLLEQIGRAEETMTKLALQNYAFCGVVFAAYFTQKIPFIPVAFTVCVISLLFTGMMAAHAYRFKYLYVMHRIAADAWLRGKTRSDMNAELRAVPLVSEILDMRGIELQDYYKKRLDYNHPTVVVALLPLCGTIVWAVVLAVTSFITPTPACL
jgi:hypothetical protein